MTSQNTMNRRKLLTVLGGAAAVTIPDKWGTPVVSSTILPAHAATSAGYYCAPFGSNSFFRQLSVLVAPTDGGYLLRVVESCLPNAQGCSGENAFEGVVGIGQSINLNNIVSPCTTDMSTLSATLVSVGDTAVVEVEASGYGSISATVSCEWSGAPETSGQCLSNL